MGNYQQSVSGPPANGGGGMQAMMERMMNDPAYQERFEKMSKKEQEAELQKYMGRSPATPSGPTAAERQAQKGTDEGMAALTRQNELAEIMKRLRADDAEFARKNEEVSAAPGGYQEIDKEIQIRISKLPTISRTEAGDFADPVKVQALQRERATRERARATWELKQRAELYAKHKAQYKQAAADYAAWARKSLGPMSNQTAQILDDSTVEVAISCEEQLIEMADDLGKYTKRATTEAAYREQAYQKTMSEPLAH
jgi:hypothetical protein